MNAVQAAWSRRSASERRTLAWGGALLAIALLVAFIWLPLQRTRDRLAAELPALRASIAALERNAAEVTRLRGLPPAATQAGTPLASLATNAGGLPGAQVNVIDARRVRVTGSDLSFSGLLEWVRNAQATHGMRVESARIDALPAAGRVRAELLLTRG